MLNTQNVVLKMTAGRKDQFPRDGKVQIALSGRSNVGKSSLINTLLGRKSFARTSAQPGKTITINFYEIDKKLYRVDLPGYGYARRSGDSRRVWASLTNDYLESGNMQTVLQLIDLKVGPTEDDYMMLEWLEASETPYRIIATKCDKLNKTDFAYNLSELQKLGPVIPFSSLKGIGKDDVWRMLYEFLGDAT